MHQMLASADHVLSYCFDIAATPVDASVSGRGEHAALTQNITSLFTTVQEQVRCLRLGVINVCHMLMFVLVLWSVSDCRRGQ